MPQHDPEALRAIEQHFHALIHSRAGDLLQQHPVTLPDLSTAPHGEAHRAWLPIPGMYGGFAYWLEGEGADTLLITESWCRVVGGSGQRHEITASGYRLVDEGFV